VIMVVSRAFGRARAAIARPGALGGMSKTALWREATRRRIRVLDDEAPGSLRHAGPTQRRRNIGAVAGNSKAPPKARFLKIQVGHLENSVMICCSKSFE
jgi:hypothetical protein